MAGEVVKRGMRSKRNAAKLRKRNYREGMLRVAERREHLVPARILRPARGWIILIDKKAGRL